MDYLAHHGILGQKWGIRRYQNEDGSLTPAGIKRYQTNKKFRKKIDTERAIAEQRRKADARNMTNQELQEAINRMNLEDNYNRLMETRIQKLPPSTGDKAKKVAVDFLKKAGNNLANELSSSIGKNTSKIISEAIFGKENKDGKNGDKNKNGNNNAELVAINTKLKKEQLKQEKLKTKEAKKKGKNGDSFFDSKSDNDNEILKRISESESGSGFGTINNINYTYNTTTHNNSNRSSSNTYNNSTYNSRGSDRGSKKTVHNNYYTVFENEKAMNDYDNKHSYKKDVYVDVDGWTSTSTNSNRYISSTQQGKIAASYAGLLPENSSAQDRKWPY